jgi:hypothetical protein
VSRGRNGGLFSHHGYDGTARCGGYGNSIRQYVMWTFSTCKHHARCEGCALNSCCPVVLDEHLHEIERARQERVEREREWFEHGTILDLNSGSAHVQRDLRVMRA